MFQSVTDPVTNGNATTLKLSPETSNLLIMTSPLVNTSGLNSLGSAGNLSAGPNSSSSSTSSLNSLEQDPSSNPKDRFATHAQNIQTPSFGFTQEQVRFFKIVLIYLNVFKYTIVFLNKVKKKKKVSINLFKCI
jgi:hypothetical protein